MLRKRRKKEFDFKPLGKAIMDARDNEGLTREEVAEGVCLDPRYYAKIEAEGQYPSLGVLYYLVRMFQVSVDEHFFPNTKPNKTTKRRYIESLLDKLSDHELKIIEGAIKGVLKYKETQEQENEDDILVHL